MTFLNPYDFNLIHVKKIYHVIIDVKFDLGLGYSSSLDTKVEWI